MPRRAQAVPPLEGDRCGKWMPARRTYCARPVAHKFRRLGISEERFNELLEAQGYACAICGEEFGDRFPRLTTTPPSSSASRAEPASASAWT